MINKRYIEILLLCLISAGVQALTIPQGTLYYDNSKTGYNTVKFVYGRDDVAQTKVLDMTNEGNKWSVAIAQTEYNIYRFTFVGGEIAAGTYNQRFSDFKEYVSNTLNLNRTATSEAQMQAGDIFVPVNGDNWAQGSWMPLSAWESTQGGNSGSVTITGTLPVVYLNTTDGVAITSKEEYVPGSLYIDPLNTGYEALGSDTLPITGQFKGRGNWTWTGFDKKPYRIKFDAKQKVLGMPSNKHWCLMAGADDCMGFLKNPVGYMLSRAMGLRWTPGMVPVELVLNGEYKGLYFLTEQIRVGSNRVAVTEQEDNAVDSVSGGWLVEIDNYYEDGNVTLRESNNQEVWFTMKSPEILSQQQRTYIETQLNGLNNAIWGNNEADVWSRLDLDEAVKYYLIQEIMEDCESYHGSCYLYKERDRNGANEKWFFGPVWDFGNAYNRGWNTWIYDHPSFPQYWIGQLATWPAFQAKLQEVWWVFHHNYKDQVRAEIQALAGLITTAAQRDAQVWNGSMNYCNNSDMTGRLNYFLEKYDWRVGWLYEQWGEGIEPIPEGLESGKWKVESRKELRNGKIVILRNGQAYTLQGQHIQ